MAGGRLPSSIKASVICCSAAALSIGVMGISPQSIVLAHDLYGLMPAFGWKLRPGRWRADAVRIARGPRRAPGTSKLSYYFESGNGNDG